ENNYHQKKRQLYIENGYTPLFFRENEIYNKFDIVKSIINNKLGKSNRVYARKCKVVELDKNYAKEFFNNNHIMENGAGQTKGLEYNGEIVAAIQVKCRKKETQEYE